jgi:protein-L-isoaspartate(D-aspartate) O-methyltransferase
MLRPSLISMVLACWLPTAASALDFDGAERQRAEMVAEIEREAALAGGMTGVETLDARLLEAMRRVPRHVFVPEQLWPHAYGSHPLPLGFDQNLSAPFIIALMVHLAEVEEGSVVYETGTDTGYMAAILAELGAEVYTVEVIEPLAEIALRILDHLGYDRIRVRHEDGYFGWPEHAPFDAVIVKEAIDHVPRPLLEQLRPGGRLVMPLGPADGPQILTVIERRADGELLQRPVLPVRFSPLQGGERT